MIIKNFRLALALLVGLAAGASDSAADDSPTAPIAAAASAFLTTLDDGARAKASFAFDSEERFNWHFVPKPRAGLPLKPMSARQRSAAMDAIGFDGKIRQQRRHLVICKGERLPIKRDLQRAKQRDCEPRCG